METHSIWKTKVSVQLRCFNTWDEVENADYYCNSSFEKDDCFLILEPYRVPRYKATAWSIKHTHCWRKIWSFRHQKTMFADMWESSKFEKVC